jgi:hypothetical protein
LIFVLIKKRSLEIYYVANVLSKRVLISLKSCRPEPNNPPLGQIVIIIISFVQFNKLKRKIEKQIKFKNRNTWKVTVAKSNFTFFCFDFKLDLKALQTLIAGLIFRIFSYFGSKQKLLF